MAIHWTEAVKARLLPYPGEAWTLAADPRASARALAQLGEPPESPTLAAELARGLAAGLDHRYDAQGNHLDDRLAAHLVDRWCARAGVGFATEVLIEIVRTRPNYELRRDGQPWGRLREQLYGAAPGDRGRAWAIASAARREATGELRPALAYAFCDPAWVDEDLDDALRHGYGQLALLACLAEPDRIATALEQVVTTLYQLIEEAVPHIPNVMRRLGDAGSDLILTCASLAWDERTRAPWLELVRCYDTPAARAFASRFE